MLFCYYECKRRECERIEKTLNIPNKRSILQQARRANEWEKRIYTSNVRHDLGHIDSVCIYCGALHWLDERLSASSVTNPKFGKCCKQGKVILPTLRDPPPLLQQLFKGQDQQSKEFHSNIRQYNAAHAFTLLDVTINKSVLNGRAPYCFRIHGELHHLSGYLLPNSALHADYAQLYIHDPDFAHQIRMGRNNNLCAQTMWKIQQILQENYLFYPKYLQAHEILSRAHDDGASETDLSVYLHFNTTTDRRHYNLPTSNKVAIILPSDGSVPERMLNECEQRIEDQSNAPSLMQMDFYSFCLFLQHTEFSTILWGGKLLQEFMVNAWAATEQNCLRYLHTDPLLFDNVLRYMVYGPCGAHNPKAPCMENRKCQKKYPKSFNDVTSMDLDGYPLYARRNDGRTFNVGSKIIDNRDVVLYNPFLSRKFNCHINIEVCAS
ncbi:641_t:CDS:2, partial [Cetraspora pellucida]